MRPVKPLLKKSPPSTERLWEIFFMPRTSQLEFPICSFPTAAATPLKWVCLEVFITCLSPGGRQQPGLQLMQLIILLSLSQVPHPAIPPSNKKFVTNLCLSKSSPEGTGDKPGVCLPAQQHPLHRVKDFKALIFFCSGLGVTLDATVSWHI